MTMSQERQRLALGAIGLLAGLLLWEAVNRFGIVKSVLISSPTQVIAAAATEIGRGTLWQHTAATGFNWAIGLSLAATVGIVIGLVAGWYRPVGRVALPWLYVLEAMPSLALIPIFILWFGIGVNFKIFVIFLSAVFFVGLNTIAGVQSTERRLLDVGWSFNASQLRIFRTIILPGSVPFIITGVRQGAARALVGAIVAEFVSANEGLGFMITLSANTMNTSRLMLGIVILAVVGVFMGEVLRAIEHRFDAWRVR